MDLSNETDEQLVCRYNAQGNEYAFEELWHRHFKMTNRVVNHQRYLIMKDSKDDLMNECAIKMLTCIEKYNGSTKFITFYVHAIQKMLLSKIRVLNYDKYRVNYEAVNVSELKRPDSEEVLSDDELLATYLPSVVDDHSLVESDYNILGYIEDGLNMIEENIREDIGNKIMGNTDESDLVIGKRHNRSKEHIRTRRLKVLSYVKFKLEEERFVC